ARAPTRTPATSVTRREGCPARPTGTRPWAWAFSRGSARALLLAERLEAPGDLLGGDVLRVRRQGPDVAVRVRQRARAVAVKLVLHRTHLLRAGGDGLAEARVHVLDVEADAHRRAAQRLRAAVAHLGELVGQHDRRVADPDLGVPHLAARV